MIHSDRSAPGHSPTHEDHIVQDVRITAYTALRALLADQPTTAAKVECAWRIAAGPALARAGTTSWTGDGVLRVHAPSLAWKRELQRAKPVISERVRHVLGDDVVKRIVIETDDPATPGRRSTYR